MIQALLHIHCSKDLSFQLACILAKYPMSESKYKVFKTLDPKKRFGVISRHCMGVAHRCGVSDDFLDEIIRAKNDYSFYKKLHANNVEKQKLNPTKNVSELMDSVSTELKLSFCRSHLQHLTQKLIDIIFKSKIFTEKEWPAEEISI